MVLYTLFNILLCDWVLIVGIWVGEQLEREVKGIESKDDFLGEERQIWP